MARWSLVISDDTDRTVRAYLGAIGAKKGGLSNLVEEAVKRTFLKKPLIGYKNAIQSILKMKL